MSINGHINKSAEHRKEKKREKSNIRLIVLVFVLVAAITLFFSRDSILSRFEGMGRKSVTEAGFPVKLPGNAGYTINSFDGGFMLLTETYVCVYDPDGSQRYNNRHSYSEPYAAVADTRILAYDKNGRQFSFYGRNGLIYEKETEERILYGAIGQNESAAIVYRDDIYANIMEIYDETGEWRYTARLSNENIMQLAFTAADRDIIVTSLSFGGADVIAAVHRYDTEAQEDNERWKTVLPGEVMPFAVHIGASGVFVLCDKEVFILDSQNGEILKSYGYRGNLIDFAFDGDNAALLINDYTAGTIEVVSLNFNEEPEYISQEGTQGSTQIEILGGKIHVLEPGAIAVYSLNNETLSQSEYLALEEEYSRFAPSRQAGNEIFLLSYNKVDKFPENGENPETAETKAEYTE